jgi:hypothetical protein
LALVPSSQLVYPSLVTTPSLAFVQVPAADPNHSTHSSAISLPSLRPFAPLSLPF